MENTEKKLAKLNTSTEYNTWLVKRDSLIFVKKELPLSQYDTMKTFYSLQEKTPSPFIVKIYNVFATETLCIIEEEWLSGTTIAELIRRPELNYEDLAPIDKERPELPWDVKQQVEINLKYEGYIKRQLKQVEQFKKLEAKKIPEDLDYEKVGSLRIEARQKLEEYRPISIGQASRISGVSPADISVLLVYLEQYRRNSNS